MNVWVFSLNRQIRKDLESARQVRAWGPAPWCLTPQQPAGAPGPHSGPCMMDVGFSRGAHGRGTLPCNSHGIPAPTAAMSGVGR